MARFRCRIKLENSGLAKNAMSQTQNFYFNAHFQLFATHYGKFFLHSFYIVFTFFYISFVYPIFLHKFIFNLIIKVTSRPFKKLKPATNELTVLNLIGNTH